jgi:hypothetical protein
MKSGYRMLPLMPIRCRELGLSKKVPVILFKVWHKHIDNVRDTTYLIQRLEELIRRGLF